MQTANPMSHALLAAAKTLAARLPEPGSPTYDTYHSRLELDALRRAIADQEPCFTRREIMAALGKVDTDPRMKLLLERALDALR